VKTLLSQLRREHPDFYDDTYELQDSHTSFDVENLPNYSIGVKKVYRKINELLEKGTRHPLSECDAQLFYANFVQFGFSQDTLCPIQSNVVVRFKLVYPEFPTRPNPTPQEQMIWPNDFETSLDLTHEQKEETEQFIRAIYPDAIEDIRTDEDFRDYLFVYAQRIGNIHKGKKNHLNIRILHNGEVIVFPHYIDIIYKNIRKETLIFKVFNLSRGEWFVLKNQVRRNFIPYLTLLNDKPHIAKICDFTVFDGQISLVEKLYDKNLTELLTSKSTSIGIAQKEKFMLSLLEAFTSIHQTPYQFDKTKGYLSHADIKYDNIFYDKQADDVVIGDFSESGKWNVLTCSSCFISPELALELLKIKANNYTNGHIISFNQTKGQSNDIWNLGLVFAGILGGVVNHETHVDDAFLPDLKFILDRLQSPENTLLFMGDIASLEQEEIDAELEQIKQKLPPTPEGIKLRHLWNITHQMLQVSYQNRPSCRDLLSQMQINPVDQASPGLRRNSLFNTKRGSEPAQQPISGNSTAPPSYPQ
ncbi:TPA: hypothetical protein JA361_15420, partial [Legionella pneumophila]|nr:hypothetical protein [Legionella pneumophila]